MATITGNCSLGRGYSFYIIANVSGKGSSAIVTVESYVTNGNKRFSSNNWNFSCSVGGQTQNSSSPIKIDSRGADFNATYGPLTFNTLNGTSTAFTFSNVGIGNISVSYKVWKSANSYSEWDPGDMTASGEIYIDQGTAHFDLNILDPDGSQPFGAAGTVEQSINGGSYYTVNNESASSYNIGTTFNYRNFRPGVGRHLSSVEGVSPNNIWGPWSASLGSGGLTVTFRTAWDTHTVYYNANGGNSTPSSNTVNYGTTIRLANAITKNNTDSTGTIYLYYNANGGSGAPETQNGTYVNTTPYSFSNWGEGSVNGVRYGAGSNYTVTQDITMYAIWATGSTYRKTNPTITISSTTPSRTYYTFEGWSTNSGAASASYSPGNNITISGDTTLYAVWEPNLPTDLTISRTDSSTTSISVSVGATGLTMTNYTLYYRVKNNGNYIAKSLGTATTGTITGLAVDTDYQIYFTATNAGGTAVSDTVIYSTTLTTPSLTTPVKSNTFPFMTTISATGSISPSRTLKYAFSKDGGSTWTRYQSSSSYHWTGLDEETTYSMGVKVKATHVGINASDTTRTKYISVTTPTNQARMRIKKEGQWKKGKTFLKTDEGWMKAKKIYTKIDGVWVENKNFYDGEPSLWD